MSSANSATLVIGKTDDENQGVTANAFAPDDLNDLVGGACFNDARVEVTAV